MGDEKKAEQKTPALTLSQRQRQGQKTIRLKMTGKRRMPLCVPGHPQLEVQHKAFLKAYPKFAAAYGKIPRQRLHAEGVLPNSNLVWLTADEPIVFELGSLDYFTKTHIDRALAKGQMEEV